MERLLDLLLNFYGPTAYLIVFGILLACGFGVPIPEDITIITGGLLVYYGLADIRIMLIVCFAGVMVGDAAVFWLGRRFGMALTKKWIFKKLLHEDRLAQVSTKLKTKGAKLLFAARFMPGFRTPIFFAAGSLGVPFSRLFLYDGFAALISVPAIIFAVRFFGDEIDGVVQTIKKVEGGIFFAILVIISLVFLKWHIHSRRTRLQREGAT